MTDRTADPNHKISYHATFTGRVQGVGFRFTARRFAVDLGLKGWVRNLADGDVELYVEGDAPVCKELIRRLEEHFMVHDLRLGEGEPSSGLTGFEIRY